MRARRARRDRANGGRAGAATRGEGGGYVAFRAGSMDPSAPLDARVHGGDPRGIHGGSTGAPRGLHGGSTGERVRESMSIDSRTEVDGGVRERARA